MMHNEQVAAWITPRIIVLFLEMWSRQYQKIPNATIFYEYLYTVNLITLRYIRLEVIHELIKLILFLVKADLSV